MAEDAEVMTAAETADLLRVSTKTVLTLARDGALPGTKVGRAWRFLRTDVVTYVHKGGRDGTGQRSGAVAS
jgi:excisionase family DNA binding protein